MCPVEKSKWQDSFDSFGTSLFAELKPLYTNPGWITKNNVKANTWKQNMKVEANKEFMENLSLQNTFLYA